jgi:hypothetical protein
MMESSKKEPCETKFQETVLVLLLIHQQPQKKATHQTERKKKKKRREECALLTKSGGGSDGHIMPGEAGGHPDGDRLPAAPPVPLLHQHPSRPHLPLDLPGASSAGRGRAAIVAAAAGSGRLLLGRGGDPLEEPLGVAQLDHGRKRRGASGWFNSCVCVCVCVADFRLCGVVPRLGC